MPFPNYKWLKVLKIKDGWEDRGEVGSELIDGMVNFDAHIKCRTRLHVGIDSDGSRFLFCPKCLIKLNWKLKDK